MYQYRRTTNASRRAERKIRYIHESAPIITIPHPTLKNTDGTPALMPVLRTRASFPNDISKALRGNTLNLGRNKTKLTKSERRLEKAKRRYVEE